MSPTDRALVVGMGVTAQAVARQLVRRGTEVVVVDDRPTDEARARAGALGVEYLSGADPASLVASVAFVSPSPGVPARHPAIQAALAAGVPVWSEFELYEQWDSRPTVAVTGTNGKTTVTTLVTQLLVASGVRAVAAGNNELPLVDAIDDAEVELFVVEASSFRLEFTTRFRPRVGTWLNLAPDHLDWHDGIDDYEAAKARLWAAQRADDVAVGNAEDPTVSRHLGRARARRVTFGLDAGDYRVRDGVLSGPEGLELVDVAELPRRLPHDVSNALAASATALAAGADLGACRSVLRAFEGLPHRVQLVRDAGGVRWYDDSKATTPASVAAALRGFPSVVLIAGGRNKGLDLRELAAFVPPVHAVVAIGEAAPAVLDAFGGVVPAVVAASMDDAVAAAASFARPGDAVLLSPGCASQDWYRDYGERGDDFARAVRAVEVPA